MEAVRDNRFKMVFKHEGYTYGEFLPGMDGKPGNVIKNAQVPVALYDLRRDPGERYDVQSQYLDVVKNLMKIADEAREDLGDDLTGNPGKNRRPAGKIE